MAVSVAVDHFEELAGGSRKEDIISRNEDDRRGVLQKKECVRRR
jgi:hypothetical protein